MHQIETATSPVKQNRFGQFSRQWLLRLGAYGSITLGLSALVALWLGMYHFTESQRQHTLAAAAQNASNLARTFEENIVRSIRSVDQTILYVRNLYAADPRRFDLSVWEKNTQFLNDLTFQVAIIDPNGIMVKSNIPGSSPGVDLSDREHFRYHVGRETDDLFISKPVLGRVSNKWSIQLTRKVIMPDGSFGGVVVLSVDPAYLSEFYRSIDIGDNGSIALVGLDGIVRARAARTPSPVAQSLSESPLFAQLKNAESGHYIAASQIDQVERLFVYRTVRDFPLVVVVGLSMNEIFAIFNRETTTGYIVASVLSLWLICVTALIALYQRALGRAVEQAEAATRARSQFLATMSHEIRTPMNAIIGLIDVLHDSRLDPTIGAHVSLMRESAEHLLKILNDILDFSKLDASLFEIESIEFDPCKIVESAVAMTRRAAEQKGLTVEEHFAADLPARLIGDPARIRQIITNLLSNATKFTRKGGISIEMQILPADSAEGQRLSIKIRDTGIGIAPDAMNLLFQEFSQVDGSIARRFGGTGLGLAISKKLSERMGGTILAQSAVGEGTCFELLLPAKMAGSSATRPQSHPRAELAGPPAIETSPYDILIVDDDATNGLVATLLLERLGLTAKVVANGREALDAWSKADYPVILMDVMMPEMDGLAAARAIRADSTGRRPPTIIALTASAMSGDRDVCLEAGMDDFMSKPVTLAALRQKLSARIRNARSSSGGDAERAFDRDTFEKLRGEIGERAYDVLRSFGISLPDRRRRIQQAMQDKFIPVVAREAHSLKSAAAAFGFSDLARRGADTERLAQSPDGPDFALSVRLLCEAIERHEATIASMLAQRSRAA